MIAVCAESVARSGLVWWTVVVAEAVRACHVGGPGMRWGVIGLCWPAAAGLPATTYVERPPFEEILCRQELQRKGSVMPQKEGFGEMS